MENKDSLWNRFILSGKVDDYLAYCSMKEGTVFGDQKRTDNNRCTGSERDECRGE